jgi:uncharacterized membrane protein YdbT with pleckstrin-like domain
VADYIQQSLAPGERILARGRWPTLHWIGAWAVLILLGVFIIGIVWFAVLAIRMQTTKWAVTDRRVILKRGWLRRATQELGVESLEAAVVKQSVFGRVFNYGHIALTGSGEALLEFPPTQDPVAFRRSIEIARDQGLHPPSGAGPATTQAAQ